MSATKTVREITTRLENAKQTILDEIAALRATITATQKALLHARTAPPPVDELLTTRNPAIVAAAGAEWLRSYGISLLHGGEGSLGDPQRVGSGSVTLPWQPRVAPSWGAMCAGMPDVAIDMLNRLVRAVEFEPGPPSAERPAVIARLAGELADLESREEALIDDAGAAGIQIPHRPEVIARRNDQASARQREEDRNAGLRERQAALDRAHAARLANPRMARSPYLEASRADRPPVMVERPVE